MQAPYIKAFFDEGTSSLSYLVADPDSRKAAVIDPVWRYDAAAGQLDDVSLLPLAKEIEKQGFDLIFILDTHIHADHMTGMNWLKSRLGGQTAIGAAVPLVLRHWVEVYDLEGEVPVDGRQFDRVLADGDVLDIGGLKLTARATPGHTPACSSYVIGTCVFVGDTIFSPDYGSARCDFPGGDAATLYDSLMWLYGLPDATRVFLCHDYMPGGRALAYETSVGAQKRENIHIRAETKRADFVRFRKERDLTLGPPGLILPALQVNIRGGRLPPKSNKGDGKGRRFLKIPLGLFDSKERQ